MTSTQLAFLKSMSVTHKQAFEPYELVCNNQDDACTLSKADTKILHAIMMKLPHVLVSSVTSDGLRLKFASRTADDRYLFLEIEQTPSDRFFVTSFVDDFDYFISYMPLETV